MKFRYIDGNMLFKWSQSKLFLHILYDVIFVMRREGATPGRGFGSHA